MDWATRCERAVEATKNRQPNYLRIRRITKNRNTGQFQPVPCEHGHARISDCRECAANTYRAWVLANREKRRASQRAYEVRRRRPCQPT